MPDMVSWEAGYFGRGQKKETKIILWNIYYYSPHSKNSISLKVGEETKLLPDSVSLCTRGYKPKPEKSFFFWPPIPLETALQPWG